MGLRGQLPFFFQLQINIFATWTTKYESQTSDILSDILHLDYINNPIYIYIVIQFDTGALICINSYLTNAQIIMS